MGVLVDGTPMSWEELRAVTEEVKRRGVVQFINMYNKHKDRNNDPFLWGDEMEYTLVKMDHDKRHAVLNLKAAEVLHKIAEKSKTNSEKDFYFMPEFAQYQVEGIPGLPYGRSSLLESLTSIENNMKKRRQAVASILKDNEHVLTITTFPRLGCGAFTSQTTITDTPTCNSNNCDLDDLTTTMYPRYLDLLRNKIRRRNEDIECKIPVFRDVNTPLLYRDNLLNGFNTQHKLKNSVPNYIHMDHSIFGVGICCLQVTFQAKNLDEAKLIHDQLVPFAPIMLALGAASPLWKGQISDIDTRWPVRVQCGDDRTKEERTAKYGQPGYRHSRAGSIDCYLNSSWNNDKSVPYDEKTFAQLKNEGVDEPLARYISHEFVHEPLTLCKESLHENDDTGTDLFETVHSTNWKIVRLKMPNEENNLGWRVEFRPMDIQLTDFENAAFVVFLALLVRVVIEYKLNFTIPLTYVDQNIEKASKRNAVLEETFYFKQNVEEEYSSNDKQKSAIINNNNEQCVPLTIKEIMHGKGQSRGVLHYINKYLDESVSPGKEERKAVKRYIEFISDRATGKEMTRARWIRHFVEHHPDYQQDSVISDVINCDLMLKCTQLSNL